MARADDEVVDDEVVVSDSGAMLGSAMVVVTGVMLLIAIWIVLTILRDQYNAGLLASN